MVSRTSDDHFFPSIGLVTRFFTVPEIQVLGPGVKYLNQNLKKETKLHLYSVFSGTMYIYCIALVRQFTRGSPRIVLCKLTKIALAPQLTTKHSTGY
jgi:hypothetical protein